MKQLLTATALTLAASAAIADCAPPMDDLVAMFEQSEPKVTYACRTNYPMQDLDQCLDSQFRDMQLVAAMCDDNPAADAVVNSGMMHNRHGEHVGVDFRTMRLEMLKQGVY